MGNDKKEEKTVEEAQALVAHDGMYPCVLQ